GLAGLGYCEQVEAPPVIISTPVTDATVGLLYSYDVDASGYPAPTYSLTTSPAGMTIDPVNGLIQWTPPDTTDASVTVEATNTAKGVDSQSFTIVVEEAPPCPPDMVAYWHLDEAAGTTYTDTYDGHDGNASPAPPTPDPDGIVGSSQDFNGTSNWIDVPDHPDFDWSATSSFTVELWAKFTNVASRNKVMIGRDQAGGTPHWWLGAAQSTGLVTFNLLGTDASGIACNGTTAINDGVWHHIVAVRDEDQNQNRIYVDGDLEDTKTYDYTVGFGASTPLGIGYMAYNFNPDYYYDGLLDEIAIYNRDLTKAEIIDHYNAGLAGQGYCEPDAEVPVITSIPVTSAAEGVLYTYDVDATGYPEPTYNLTVSPAGMTIDPVSGLIEWTPPDSADASVTVEATNSAKGVDSQSFTIIVDEAPPCPAGMLAYWQLEETSGTTYYDAFDGHDGAASTPAPTPATGGIVGDCQSFDGSSNYIEAPDHADFDWALDASFTIELWMKFTDISGQNKVAIGRDEGGGYPHWWFGANASTGYANFNLLDTNRNGAACTGSVALNDDQWHYLVAVRDESEDENRLYVDGAPVDSVTHDYTAGFEANTPVAMGYMAYNFVPGYFYNGLLDEVALYDRALTGGEILAHYTNGLAGQGYCVHGPDPEAPVITSTPDTTAVEGMLYSYDVDATGYPAPTFALTQAPAGMTIDPVSGLIQWTPASAGDDSVIVEAANTAKAVDTQSFVIHVSEPPPCPADLTHLWRLDETGGPPYVDYWAGSDAGCSNCPDPVTGQIGGALWFNGTDDEVTVPYDGTMEWAADASFSIAFWMKTGESTSGNRVIVGRDASDTQLHWWVGANDGGQAHLGLRDNDNHYEGCSGTSTINDDAWHFVVAVRDESTNENRIYVDAEQENSVTYDYTGAFTGDAALNIGFLELSGHYRYHGAVDEVVVFDRALPDDEIARMYHNGLQPAGYCDPVGPSFISAPLDSAYLDEPYVYDCDAAGNPAPTYSLVTAPEGMTIDPVTGEITWIPPVIKDRMVTIQASNASGSVEQNYIIDVTGPVGVPEGIPERHFLAVNRPNPFNPKTTIHFGLPAPGQVKILIFDIQGRKVATLVDAVLPVGVHRVDWEGRDDSGALVSSGIYFYQLATPGFSQTRKMTLLK
ncbi:MAG: LamG-like jellyroll fold domain-containing protein, partial [bacterium]